MADLRPLTPEQPGPDSSAAGVMDAETLRYALKAWLREEGFYDVKVRIFFDVGWTGWARPLRLI